MGIFDALTTAVSGLQSQSFALQNISGNIANASTVGYKGIDTSFEDLIPDALNPQSQVAGGVIMGVNYALFEERIMDRVTGRQVNPDMEFYKLGGIQDLPRVDVHMHDMPERGVIGIGEPPTISSTPAGTRSTTGTRARRPP